MYKSLISKYKLFYNRPEDRLEIKTGAFYVLWTYIGIYQQLVLATFGFKVANDMDKNNSKESLKVKKKQNSQVDQLLDGTIF